MPSASMTLPVGARGPARSASARRSMPRRLRARRRAPAANPRGQQAEDDERGERPGHEPGGEEGIAGRGEGKPDQRRDHGGHQQQIAPAAGLAEPPAPAAAPALQHVAEELARRQIAGPHQGGQREPQRRQQAEAGRQQQRLRIDGGRQIEGEIRGQRSRRHEGRQRPQEDSDRDPAQRQEQDQGEIEGEDGAGRCAQAFEDGDGRGLALQEGLDRIADADAADEQRREPDQGQEQGRAVDEALHPRGGIVQPAQPPAGIGEAVVEGGAEGLVVQAGAVGDAIEAIDQASRLDQPRLRQARLGDHQPGAEQKGPGAAIGLAGDDGAKLIGQLAHGDPVAELHAQAVQHLRIGDGAPDAIMPGQGRLQRPRGRQLHVTGQGIGAIHRLHLHQLPRRSIGGARHGPEAVDGADLARRREGLHLQGICQADRAGGSRYPRRAGCGRRGRAPPSPIRPPSPPRR